MTASRSITLTLATSTLAFTSPALAQQDASGAVYQSNPVIQPLPVLDPPPPPAPPLPPPPPAPEPVETFEEETYTAPPIRSDHANGYPDHYRQAPYPGSYPGAYPGQYPYPMAHHSAPQHFDREAWLADCRERIRGVDRKDRGGVIGGLLGAVAGGVIGNRAWGSERLAGTLLGAGVGGLAGIAIGAAVGAAGERRREDECAWHLDRHMASFPQGPAYGYPSYGYGYPAIAYVPVLVQVPQRAIVREYVTEEWVDGPARSETITETTVVRQPASAPRADKRIKLIKGR